MPGARTLESIVDDFDKADGGDYAASVEDHDDGSDDDLGTDAGTNDADNGSDAGDDGRDGDDDALVQEAQRGQRGQQDGQRQDTRSPQRKDDLRQLPNGLLQDKQGNLVHPQTGAIIARAGESRRHYERAQRAITQLEQSQSRVQTLERELQSTRVLNDMPRQMGLSNEDLQVALPLVGEFVKNPVVAARKIIEMVASMGHNLSDIFGGNAGDSIEMAAISRMLDERLKPLQQLETQRHQEQQAQESRTRAEQAVQEFFASYENAEMHAQEIDNLIGIRVAQGDKNFSPEKAYYELKLFCAQNNLDFNQPLRPQLEARQSATRQQPNNSDNRQPTRQNMSLPNGRGGAPRTMDETEYADSNADWGDIIKGALSRHMRN